MKQYELNFDKAEDIDSYYVDASAQSFDYGNRTISSSYTSYGIKCIDSQYCRLIQNLNQKVKQLYAINRRYAEYSNIKTREAHKGYECFTYYDKIELDQNYCEVRVEWENGQTHDFFYGNKPKFDLITRKTDPDLLKNEIIDNPHLHVKIKENLISNLESYKNIEC